ncbi:uncharacterized protein LOC135694631 [Rhopilema esculentum]|uniref:uncharacterized protein LOC135694631 n=1 Tax=Rhopilema esculentum TaxID=499914 RepID=UPI0031DAE6EC
MKSKHGEIKRGENLHVKLLPSSQVEEILRVARQKHCAFNKRFNDKGTYKLAYKDGSEVVNVPGTEEPFSLKRFKEESGFNDARIALYLQPTRLTFSEVLGELAHDNESEEDNLLLAPIDPLSPLSHKEDFAVEISQNPSAEIVALAPGIESSKIVQHEEEAVNEQMSPIPGTSYSNLSQDDGQVECPTSFVKFPVAEVSQHADECADEFWSRSDSDIIGHITKKVCGDEQAEADIPSLRTEIKKIKESNLDKTKILVTVR